MAIRGAISPYRHYHVSDDAELLPVTLRCTGCGSTQTERLEADAPLREVVSGLACLFCGRSGSTMRLAKVSP